MPALMVTWYLPAPIIQTAWMGPVSGTQEQFPGELDPFAIPTIIGPPGPPGPVIDIFTLPLAPAS